MNEILNAVILLGALGAVCAILLVLASKFMAVPVDEKFPRIRGCLPGANCGACGYAGCDGYAQALADGTETRINLCVPGADAAAQALADATGLEYQDVVEQVALVCCRGDCETVEQKQTYEGVETCRAAKLLFGGPKACTFGCIGLGDCVRACPNNAIGFCGGIAHVDTRVCTGCGICAKTCPNGVIRLVPDVARTLVSCSSREKGASTRKKCVKGCIGCKKCEKNCPAGAITVQDNLAVIDYEKCTSCGKCAEVCTTGCIRVADFRGIHKQDEPLAGS